MHELRSSAFKDKAYEECLPLLAESLQSRMRWIWVEELDAIYDKVRSDQT